MRRLAIFLVVLAACSGETAGPSTTTTTSMPATTTTSLAATTTTTPPPECPEAPYEVTALPAGVGTEASPSGEPDVWTEVAGSRSTLYLRDDGTVAIALVRGTLPAVDWPGERGEISIDGTRAVVGPHPDGTWVAGWFEEPGERCDQYTMVFYPPWNPSDVEAVLEGMNRVGG